MPRTVQFQLGGTLKFIDEPDSRPGAVITLRYDGLTIKARADDMAYTLPDDKQVQVKVEYVDAHGHPAEVDGPVAWRSSDESIATVTADSTDSSLASIVPVGTKLGQVQIVATADADLGAGVTTLITPMDVEIVGGQAVAGTITPVGEPTPLK